MLNIKPPPPDDRHSFFILHFPFRSAGFMLIELVIASFVIGVALLGILAMLNSGLRQATESDNETRASIFIDDVMTTLRLLNDRAASDETNSNAWNEFWLDLSSAGGNNAITQFTGFATASWSERYNDKDEPIYTDGKYHFITNYWRPETNPIHSDGVRDYVIQYRIDITNAEDYVYFDADNRHPIYYKVQIHAWNGASRSGQDDYNVSSFFTNPGRLK